MAVNAERIYFLSIGKIALLSLKEEFDNLFLNESIDDEAIVDFLSIENMLLLLFSYKLQYFFSSTKSFMLIFIANADEFKFVLNIDC